MTQFDTDQDDNEYEDDDSGGAMKELRSQLRATNKALKEAKQQVEANQAAARRVAFLDAGIPDNPQIKFFREHYQGDLTPEAIKAQAAEYGFVTDVDHTEDLGELAAQSEAALGADGPTALGSEEEMRMDMDRAAREAPRGQESRAIQEVVARYNRHV